MVPHVCCRCTFWVIHDWIHGQLKTMMHARTVSLIVYILLLYYSIQTRFLRIVSMTVVWNFPEMACMAGQTISPMPPEALSVSTPSISFCGPTSLLSTWPWQLSLMLWRRSGDPLYHLGKMFTTTVWGNFVMHGFTWATNSACHQKSSLSS